MNPTPSRILMVVNAEWYFLSHRLPLALALRARGHEVIVAAGVERGLTGRIEAAGLRFVTLPMVRGRLALLSDVATCRALVRLYRSVRPDLVYHTTIKPILYGSAVAHLTGVRRVVNAIPGLGHVFAPSTMLAAWREAAVSRAYALALRGRGRRVIFQNEDDRALFVSRGIALPARSVVIRGSGVDLRVFAPQPAPADRRPIVLLASRLLWQKGVQELVDATRLLRADGVVFRTVIVGIPDPDSPDRVPRETLEAWSAEGLIEWWGLRGDMPEVIAQSSIVTLPSYYREGVPKILLEAAASSRPAVTTNMPGCREAVRDGYNGILVPPRDAPALAAALRRLLGDASLRQAMGRNARQLAEAEFDEQTLVGQAVDVCEGLLRERSPV